MLLPATPLLKKVAPRELTDDELERALVAILRRLPDDHVDRHTIVGLKRTVAARRQRERRRWS